MSQTILDNSSLILSETTYDTPICKKNEEQQENIPISSKSTIKSNTSDDNYTLQIQWLNVTIFAYLHLGALYAFYLIPTRAYLVTTIFAQMYGTLSGIGITAGAHRLWTHQSYKAKWPLRVILCIFQTMAFQNDIYEWSRDHRVHHKFAETDADPHNAKRGFFFSHVGWLMVKKHADVKIKGKTVDMSDLEQDPIVMFQKRYYGRLMLLLCFILPTFIPWYFWNESFWVSWYVAGIWRFVISLNGTWLVNSAAHIWGNKPYDKNIGASNNPGVAWAALGEGWHNYHHVFPWDYKTSELGNYSLNITTAFIDFFSYIGWAYDLKTVPYDVMKKRILRTGDGSHHISQEHSHEGQTWGWGDKDMTDDNRNCAMIIKSKTK